MKATAGSPSLLSWYPFLSWETAQPDLPAEGEREACAEPLESALPSAVEAGDEADAAMARSAFTSWF